MPPNIDTLLPNRWNERRLRHEPVETQFKMLNALPISSRPKTDIEEPKRITARTDRELPAER
jgi:hypothetical protein